MKKIHHSALWHKIFNSICHTSMTKEEAQKSSSIIEHIVNEDYVKELHLKNKHYYKCILEGDKEIEKRKYELSFFITALGISVIVNLLFIIGVI